jgi:hypothetical protein
VSARSRQWTGRRRPSAAVIAVAAVAGAIAIGAPVPAAGQLSAPCEVKCGVVLGASSYAVATAAMVGWGRHTGGMRTGKRAAGIWLASFALAASGGLALGGDGARQERVVYASGLGLVAGGVIGLAVGSLRSGEPGDLLAMNLIGAGIGSLIGGVVGALTYERETPGAIPVLTIRIPI